MIKRLILTAAVAATLATPAAAEPAMWVVRDRDSTIYLLGTVHLLRPEVTWRTARIDAALKTCTDLTLELADGDGSTAAAGLISRYGFDKARPLSSRLTKAEQARLAEAAATLGFEPGRLESMRPWLAGLTLSVAPILRAGYDRDAGVEKLLSADAMARGAPVRGLETTEQQVRVLATLPDEVQLDLLREALDDYEQAPTELDRMAAAWAAGDVRTIDRLVNDEVRKDSPELYRAILADRNTDFARQIKAMLDDSSGARCVAVGAGHLAGRDSVQARLKALGIEAERF